MHIRYTQTEKTSMEEVDDERVKRIMASNKNEKETKEAFIKV